MEIKNNKPILLSVRGDIVYLVTLIDAKRGIRNKNKTTAKEIVAFGCNKRKHKDKLIRILNGANLPQRLIQKILEAECLCIDFRGSDIGGDI